MSNSHVRDFANLYQYLVREDLPVFLLMAGLYDNVERLQNVEHLTFLYRAPKIRLEALGMRSIALNYERILCIDHREAQRMARLTNGYPFAFQLLGQRAWEHHGLTDEAFDEYRTQLSELSYDKIWSELSDGDRSMAHGIATAPSSSVMDVRSILDLKSNEFSPYRRCLIRMGVIDGSERGKVSFTLPLFRAYVLERYGEIDI